MLTTACSVSSRSDEQLSELLISPGPHWAGTTLTLISLGLGPVDA